MRRISLALALVGSIMASAAATHAATPQPLHHSTLTHVIKKAGFSHVAGPSSLQHRTDATQHLRAMNSRANAPAGQSVQALFLAASAYAPAVINQTYNYTEDESFASSNWFRSFHSANYATWGYVNGVYQRADLGSSSNPNAIIRYQGAIMNSASNAANAFLDGVTYTQQQSGASSSNCAPSGSDFQCRYMTLTYTTSAGVAMSEEYDTVQFQQCLAETTIDLASNVVAAYGSQAQQIQTNVDQAALNAMRNTCGSNPNPNPNPQPQPTQRPQPTPVPTQVGTQFNVVSVRLEKDGADPDWNLTNAPITAGKAPMKVQLSAYYDVQSAPANSQAQFRISITLNGKTIYNKPDDPFTLTDPPDTYRHRDSFTLKKAGTYRFSVQVTVNGRSDTGDTTLTLKKKYKAPKKVSFSFDSLQTTNSGGGATSTFHVNEPVTIKLHWTVKNLKGHTTGVITRTLLWQVKGEWRPVNTNRSSTTVVNGGNDFSNSFPVSAPGAFQVAVSVGVGASSQAKTATINIVR